MKEQLLAFFGFPTDQAAGMAEELRRHWPDRSAPDPDPHPVNTSMPQIKFFDSWDRLLTQGQPVTTEPSVCVVAIHNEADCRSLFPFLDALADRSVPTMILADDAPAVRDRFYEDEIIVCPIGEPVDRMALRLHALVSRQKVVRQLKSDLQEARR